MIALSLGAPWWLTLALVVPALWWIDRHRWRTATARRAQALGPRLAPPAHVPPFGRAATWQLIALAATALAAAEPRWGAPEAAPAPRALDVVVCLDVSRSMRARDVSPDRLDAARRMLARLCERAAGDRIGLVAFAGAARLVVPLTRDLPSLVQIADQLDDLSVPRGGTDPGAALDEALAALVGRPGGTVLLLGDGDDPAGSGIAAARRCRTQGVVVHTAGLGSARGAKIPVGESGAEAWLRDAEGREVVAQLDAQALTAIAEAAAGTYIDGATAGARALVELYEQEVLPRAQLQLEADGEIVPAARFQWPLALALAALLALTLLGHRPVGAGRSGRVRVQPLVLLPLALWSLAACGAPAASAGEPQPRPPSVLLLLADDLRRDVVGAFGGAFPTPRLDALAADGTVLSQIVCMGSRHGAVCAPSRAMLLTGRGLTHVRDDLRSAVTLPEAMRDNGYATFLIGKWHNGDAALRRAFPDARAVFRGGMCDHFRVPLVDLEAGRLHNERTGDRHSSELFADAAVDFLRQQGERGAASPPFFAWVAFTAPHDPRDPPLPWRERLAALPLPPLPVNFRDQHGLALGEETMQVRDEQLLGWPREPELLRSQLADYRALVAHLDEQIGRVLDALAAAGLADDTLVVFASDHGLALGSHGLLGKQSLYDHSMGAPVILRGPGVPAAARCDGAGYLFDLTATIAAATGTAMPAGCDGRDLLPVIRGEAPAREAMLLLYADTQRALRRGRYELLRFPAIDMTLLFDLQQDPHEMRDLAADPAHAALVAELGQRLCDEQRLWGDALPWTADPVLPATVDLTGALRQPDLWQPLWIVQKYFR